MSDGDAITTILNIHRLARQTVGSATAAMFKWKPEFRAIVYRAIAAEAQALATKADAECDR